MNWRTATVVQLCEGMRESQDYSATPILADALQDADYPHAGVLARLRNDLPLWEAERLVALIYSDKTADAVEWLDGYALELGPAGYPMYFDLENDAPEVVMTYEMLVNAAREYATTGDDGLGAGSMSWSNATCDENYKQFWDKWALVTGGAKPNDDDGFFSCSC